MGQSRPARYPSRPRHDRARARSGMGVWGAQPPAGDARSPSKAPCPSEVWRAPHPFPLSPGREGAEGGYGGGALSPDPAGAWGRSPHRRRALALGGPSSPPSPRGESRTDTEPRLPRPIRVGARGRSPHKEVRGWLGGPEPRAAQARPGEGAGGSVTGGGALSPDPAGAWGRSPHRGRNPRVGGWAEPRGARSSGMGVWGAQPPRTVGSGAALEAVGPELAKALVLA